LHISTVAIGETTARCRFEVRDTGVGIPPDELAIIFQPFEQVGAAQDRAGGTGLGLSISRQLIGLMGGAIEVESRAGDGSRFFFELDLDIVSATPSLEVAAAPAVTGYAGPRRTALIVDDTPANRAVLVAMLSQLGFETIEAADGLEGRNMAQAISPDLILMDITMPVMDGYASMQAIREIDALRATPIIALSAGATKDVQTRSLAAGADAFLTKPVDYLDLVQMMVRHLKLDWISGDEQPHDAEPGDVGPMVALPEAEIATLLNLARVGNMRAIRSYADELIALDDRYRPFAEKLQNLARSFQSSAILHLIEQHATSSQAASA
jgi:CheY-like chemotaxis protein